MEVKFPWTDADGKRFINLEENQWMINFVLDKQIPFKYTEKPNPETQVKVENIVNYLRGSRNFILIISDNSAYIKSLYYYVALTWLTTTNQGFEIAELNTLDKSDYDYLSRLEKTSLLLVPYTDPGGYELRRIRNIIGNILIKRKVRYQPTLIDMFIKDDPTKLSWKNIIPSIGALSSIYGDQCVSMFLDKDSNSKIIKIKR